MNPHVSSLSREFSILSQFEQPECHFRCPSSCPFRSTASRRFDDALSLLDDGVGYPVSPDARVCCSANNRGVAILSGTLYIVTRPAATGYSPSLDVRLETSDVDATIADRFAALFQYWPF
jgi:hypothetical protein